MKIGKVTNILKRREKKLVKKLLCFWILLTLPVFMFLSFFQLIPPVLSLPPTLVFMTRWCFRHYMITTEHLHISLLKWAQKCKIVCSQTLVYLEIWNQQMFLDIPFLEKHADWETLTQKIENSQWCFYVLSKT